ncbi:MAG: MopE-related protein [Pseudomonadota bacterium]|nr:MopE-related protein [Pseudomonadota bacterium]
MRASLLLALMLVGCDGGLKDPPKDTDTASEAAAQLVVAVESVDFGDVAYGQLQSASVSVSNPGTLELVVTTISVETPFRVSPGFLTLAPGATSTITLYVQPVEYGEFTSDLTLATEDAAIGTVAIPLRAHTLADVDGDGFDTTNAAGGTDCDDDNPDIYPGAPDEWYLGGDTNCDGANDYDRDGDGYDGETDDHELPEGQADCNDGDASYYPGADDPPYDNRDTNCDDSNDWDNDGDGYESLAYGRGSDCDDYDALVNREGVESFNGKDDDCNGLPDDEATAEVSAYVYENTGGNYDRTGYATAVGDLDGDGFAEVIVGSPYTDATTASGAGRGGVSVFRGGSSLIASGSDIDRADNYFDGVGSSDLLGNYVTVMGDHDGDGLNELAISATGTSSNTGTVYLLNGDDARGGGDTTNAIATFTGTASSYFGRGIGTEIDLNSDGLDEMVIMYASGSNNCVAVEYGSASPASSTNVSTMDAKWSTDGTEVAFYRNASVGGDLDGDGYEDLVLADGKADYGGTTDTGAMWVLWGQATQYIATSTNDIEGTATTLVRGGSSSDYDAWSVQLGDDWDGDGDNELWIYNAAEALYVVEGGTSRRAVFDPSTVAAVSYTWSVYSSDAEMIRRAGDWDGDGISEMFVFLEDESGSYGTSELFSSTNRSGTFDELDDNIGSLIGSSDVDTELSNGNVGYGMAPLGADIDGDGDSDMVTGDAEYEVSNGQAYVLLNEGITGE